MKILYKIIIFSVILGFTSCLEDLDFDQAENLVLEPTLAIDLLDFNVNQTDLLGLSILSGGTDIDIQDDTLLPDFENSLIQEDLEEVLLQFRANNTFDQEFTVQFTFFDENGDMAYAVEPIIIPANEENFIYEESIVILNNQRFLTSEIGSIELSFDATMIDSAVNANLIFNSAAVLYTRIDI